MLSSLPVMLSLTSVMPRPGRGIRRGTVLVRISRPGRGMTGEKANLTGKCPRKKRDAAFVSLCLRGAFRLRTVRPRVTMNRGGMSR